MASEHGYAYQKIAMLRYVLMKTAAFAAQYDGARRSKRHLIVGMCATLVQTVDPIAALLQIFERPAHVDDADHRQVSQRTRGRPRHDFCESRGAAFGDQDCGSTRRVGRADDRAKIMRVFDAVEHDVKAAAGSGIVERGELFGGTEGDHSLVRRAARSPVKMFAGFEADGNAPFPAESD